MTRGKSGRHLAADGGGTVAPRQQHHFKSNLSSDDDGGEGRSDIVSVMTGGRPTLARLFGRCHSLTVFCFYYSSYLEARTGSERCTQEIES